ncbi:MAG: phosphoglycerate kinase [Flavobacteriales bacterium]|nr:phosphoglycerate kinase [Flavobacteriales bacterium]
MEFQIDSYDFENKKAIIRVDFNVPLNDGKVTDNTRIKAAIPTIKKVLSGGGSVILMSHLGRPKGINPELSLNQVVEELEVLLGTSVSFCNESVGAVAKEYSSNLRQGQVLLLENLRFHEEETKGDPEFAQQLASLADVYINDAFGTAHRAHASTAVISEYVEDSLPGYLLETEVMNAQNVLHSPQRPFTAIVGGAKVSSKITVLENLLDKVDDLIIGGGMAYTFLKSLGKNIGSSLVEEDFLEKARSILTIANEKGTKVHLPEDSIIADNFSAEANTAEVASENIPDGWMGLDIGPKAIESFSSVIMNSGTILWNGPMGVFEMPAFSKGTLSIAQAVAQATETNNAYSLIGGGDSVAAVNKFGLADKVSYISTGGGAMLELLEGKTLPGVAAVMAKH